MAWYHEINNFWWQWKPKKYVIIKEWADINTIPTLQKNHVSNVVSILANNILLFLTTITVF